MINSEKKTNSDSNSGFLCGLTIGAAVGALSAILINKSDEKEIIQNFESKIKEFFQDLISESNPKKNIDKKKEIIDIEEKFEDRTPVFIKKKSAPKMFVKPKK